MNARILQYVADKTNRGQGGDSRPSLAAMAGLKAAIGFKSMLDRDFISHNLLLLKKPN